MAYIGKEPIPVIAGGTGDASFTAYAPLVGGTTSTGVLQSASTGLATSGFVLTSTGASSLPTFQAVSASGAIETIDGDSGSVTPTSGTVTISGGVTGLTTSGAGSTLDVTGTLVVAHGGTGDTSFTAYAPIVGGTTTTGVLQSASTGLATSGFVLTSTGASSLPTFQAVSASGAITTITGNSGGAESPSAGNFNIVGTGSITVVGSANTETVELTGLTNHAVLVGAGTTTITNVGPTATSGQVLQSQGSTTNPAFSTATYPSTTTINQVLYSSAANTVGGITASDNGVLISGTTGVPSWLAAGTTGQILTATTGSPPSWASPAAASITLDGDSGSASGSTITVYSDLSGNNCGASVKFSGSGSTLTLNVTSSNNDTFIGTNCGSSASLSSVNNTGVGYGVLSGVSGNSNSGFGFGALAGSVTGASNSAFGIDSQGAGTTGNHNASFGDLSLNVLTGGNLNCAFGYNTGGSLKTGIENVMVGQSSGVNLLTGSYNVFLGSQAGGTYTGNETYNVSIGYLTGEVIGESGVTRIGSTMNQTACYVAGINGVVVTGSPVLVSSSNQLGVASSSGRFKENIQDMDDFSSKLAKLRPVTFNPKGDPTTECVGLIAEEVHEVCPQLVSYDKEGRPFSVKYHDLPALLLNELQKLLRRVDELEAQLARKCK